MLFNSFEFFIFFIVVYSIYLLVNHRSQNILLLLASYLFYAAWDWRFLFLIWISTIIDYFCGLWINQSTNQKVRKRVLFLSIASNMCILGVFKYFNFFTGSFQEIMSSLGIEWGELSLRIILPVGISFYTFQTMSYTIDIYYNKLKPTKNFPDFALFVAFFPQLIAGPIERARHLLPQIMLPRKPSLEEFYKGCYLIFWGIFIKVFIADNLAKISDPIFANTQSQDVGNILTGMYAFAFQIYCDFNGYSNIARGLGKCMGFDIMINFNLPYFSTNPSEFWKRWHISLSTWLKDYLYIPLGGSRHGTLITLRNLSIVMLLGGLWHGASWTFVLWGAYHALLLIIYHLLKQLNLSIADLNLKAAFKPVKIIFFFHLTCFGWLIFRSQSCHQFTSYAQTLSQNLLSLTFPQYYSIWKDIIPYIIVLLIVQIIQYKNNDLLAIYKMNVATKALFYFTCVLLLTIWGVTDAQDFIYFQF